MLFTLHDLELRHLCTDDKQCDDELICGMDNATKSTGFNRNPQTQAPKICLCDEDNGYTEDVEDNNCNGKHKIHSFFLYLKTKQHL